MSTVRLNLSVKKYYSYLQPLFDEFAFLISKDLQVRCNYTEGLPPDVNAGNDQKKVNVIFYSYPYPDTGRVCYSTTNYNLKKCFGIKLTRNQNAGFNDDEIKKLGQPILCGKETIAIFLKNTLFVLYNFLGSYEQNQAFLLIQKLLNKSLPLFLEKKEIDKKKKEFTEYVKAQGKDKYLQMCRNLSLPIKNDLQYQNVALWEQAVEDSRIQYLKSISEISRLEKQVKKLSFLDEKKDVDLKEEFNKIAKFPGIESIFIEKNRLVFETKHMRTQLLKDGSIRDLGCFEVEINDYSENCIKIVNKTHAIGNKHHPHVNVYGEPCFGNIVNDIYNLVQIYEFAPVVDVVLRYLQTINEADSEGVSVYKWPKAS